MTGVKDCPGTRAVVELLPDGRIVPLAVSGLPAVTDPVGLKGSDEIPVRDSAVTEREGAEVEGKSGGVEEALESTEVIVGRMNVEDGIIGAAGLVATTFVFVGRGAAAAAPFDLALKSRGSTLPSSKSRTLESWISCGIQFGLTPPFDDAHTEAGV